MDFPLNLGRTQEFCFGREKGGGGLGVGLPGCSVNSSEIRKSLSYELLSDEENNTIRNSVSWRQLAEIRLTISAHNTDKNSAPQSVILA